MKKPDYWSRLVDGTPRENWPPACVEKPNQLITHPLLPQQALRGQWLKTTKTAVRSDIQKHGFWRRGTLHKRRGISSVWGSEKETDDFEGVPCILHTINQSRSEMNLFERECVWSGLQKPSLLNWGDEVLVMVLIRLDSLLKQITEIP